MWTCYISSTHTYIVQHISVLLQPHVKASCMCVSATWFHRQQGSKAVCCVADKTITAHETMFKLLSKVQQLQDKNSIRYLMHKCMMVAAWFIYGFKKKIFINLCWFLIVCPFFGFSCVLVSDCLLLQFWIHGPTNKNVCVLMLAYIFTFIYMPLAQNYIFVYSA